MEESVWWPASFCELQNQLIDWNNAYLIKYDGDVVVVFSRVHNTPI